MAEQLTGRHPRGSYAHLICTNCRSRKIKCLLPDDVQPADHPLSQIKACRRCHNLGLECYVQRTILGRPSAKRRRFDEDATPTYEQVAIAPSSTEDVPNEDLRGELHAGQYLLFSEVTATGAPPVTRVSHRAPPDPLDVFEALLSPARLMSALLSHDRRFGTARLAASMTEPVWLPELVSNGMATLLDEKSVAPCEIPMWKC